MAVALAVAGCGGSGKTKTVTQTKTQTQTVNLPVTRKATSKLKLQVKQTVGEAKAPLKLVSSLRVKPGENIVLFTEIKNQTKAKGTKLELRIDRGPAKTLKVRAGNFHQGATATATLKSADGKPIILPTLKYKCVIAPTTICPPDRAVQTKTGFQLVFNTPTTSGVPVALTATVAPGQPG